MEDIETKFLRLASEATKNTNATLLEEIINDPIKYLCNEGESNFCFQINGQTFKLDHFNLEQKDRLLKAMEPSRTR